MSSARTYKSLLHLLLGALAVLSACTKLDTVSKEQVLEAASPITIPDAGTDTDPDLAADELCDVPLLPPRLPAVSLDERACSKSGSTLWPDCIPDQCGASDFEAACKQFCQMTCERERWFCTSNHCPSPDDGSGDTYCDGPDAMTECMDLCDGDADCLNAACSEKRESSCNELSCPDGENNSCSGLTCNNSCESSLDSECDDGSAINAEFEDCGLGKDCSDCGARAECFELGAECFSTAQCCGFETGDAWCINVGTEDRPLGRCVPDCTGSNTACGDGFSCLELMGDGGESACFPLCSLSASP